MVTPLGLRRCSSAPGWLYCTLITMSAPSVAPHPLDELFRPVAIARAAEFAGRHLIIGRSNIVHDVDYPEWMGDLRHPAPACHQGWSGFGLGTDLHPTSSPVSCKKCKHGDPYQLALDLDLPERA